MDNNSELVFRITVGAVIATWIAVRIYFQKKVGGGEKISERHSRREKASYMLVSLSFFPIFLYVFAGLFGFAHFAVPGWARWLGVAVGFSGYLRIRIGKWSGHA